MNTKNTEKIEAKPTLVKVRDWDESCVKHNGEVYSLHDCIQLAKDLPVHEAPIESFYMAYESCSADNMEDFARHVAQVIRADLSFPIILAPCGKLLDGYHRMVKHIVQGDTTYKFVRLITLPQSYKSEDEDT